MAAPHFESMEQVKQTNELLNSALEMEKIRAYDVMQTYRLQAAMVINQFQIFIQYSTRENQFPAFLVNEKKYETVAIAVEARFYANITSICLPDGILYLSNADDYKYRYMAFLDFATLNLKLSSNALSTDRKLITAASSIYKNGNMLYSYSMPIKLGDKIESETNLHQTNHL